LCILQDHNKAFTWIEAEGENDAVAEYYLGKLILLRGEAGDINRAGFCFKRAADMGDVDARFEVVLGHLVGKGLKKNVKLAVEKLTILAEEKHPNSLFLLCEVFTPAGPLQNIPQAIKLLITAAEEDQTDAQFQLIKYFQENQHSNLITKKIFEKIAKRLEEIALSGNQRAQCHVGMLYSNGSTRFPKNIEKAIDFFEKSANQGNETAIERLVPLLHTAPFSKQVVKKLLFWFTQAAEKGEPSAQVNLGIFILTPTIMNPVVHSALGYYWIYKSALQKNSTAINFLKEKCIAGNKETILKMVVDQFKFRDGVEILPAISALKNISKPINIPAFFSPPALSTTGVVAKNPNPPVTVISLPLPSMASTSMFSASAAVFTNSKPVATSKKNQRQKRCWKKK
jgi:TPR repeat protein